MWLAQMWLALFLRSLYMVSETLPHKVGPNEDVKDLSGGDCNAPI